MRRIVQSQHVQSVARDCLYLSFPSLTLLLLGMLFLPLTGLHVDSSYELAVFYPCGYVEYKIDIFGRSFPIMFMSYIGSLKAWLYKPLLTWVDPTPFLVRLPNLVIAALSVALFQKILRAMGGANFPAAMLLATDPAFVLTSAFDFGPVVLLHFCFLAGIAFALIFLVSGRRWCLAIAGFLFGLGVWHKALFLWMLGGLVLASLITLRSQIKANFSGMALGLLGVGFLLGCSPLIYFNVATRGATFRTSDVLSPETTMQAKLEVLRKTLDGSVYQGFLTDSSDQTTASVGKGLAETLSPVTFGGVGIAFLLALAYLPWLRLGSRRWGIFAVAYIIAVWAQMAALKKTGGAAHHVILLWPAPHILIGVVLAAMQRSSHRNMSRIMSFVFLLFVGLNLLLLGRYYLNLKIDGTSPIWTDAVEGLRASLEDLRTTETTIVSTDWGYNATLCLMSAGELPLMDISYNLEQNTTDIGLVRTLIERRANLFVNYAPGSEQFRIAQQKLQALAEESGYRRNLLRVVRDRNGRERFQISQYAKGTRADSLPETLTTLSMADSRQAYRLDGFHEVENASWRWTKSRFSIRMPRPTACRDRCEVVVDLFIPDIVILKLGEIRLTFRVDGVPQPPAVFSSPGGREVTMTLPRVGTPTNESVIEGTVDRYLSPGPLDQRELGLIVRSVSLRIR